MIAEGQNPMTSTTLSDGSYQLTGLTGPTIIRAQKDKFSPSRRWWMEKEAIWTSRDA